MIITHVFSLLMVLKVSFFAETINAYDQLYGPISFYAWDQPHCMGNCTVVNFDDAPQYYVSRNVSSPFVAHSFRLTGRGLAGKEQLDLSVALNDSYKLPDSDPLALENPYCTHFLQSYTGFNGSMDCHDVPPFTCQRLWVNRGLPAVSQLSSVKSTMISSFTCQTIPLPAHSAWPTGSLSAKVTVRSSSSVPALPAHSAWPKGSSSAKVTVRSSSSVLPSTPSKSSSSSTDLSPVTTTHLPPKTGHVLIVVGATTYTTTYY